jgi:hypothetical protein
MFELNPDLKQALVKSGSQNRTESLAATNQLAKALELPLRQAVLSGDILDGIFEPIKLDRNVTAEFPLDFMAPGLENDFVAYTIPNHGKIPQRNIEGDYVQVPIYDIGNAIDWLLKYARDARWDILRRAVEVFYFGFTKKRNDDGWHTIMSAGLDRNLIVLDSDASPGQFTKRLVSLGKTVMRRNGGGNSSSVNRGQLTDLYVSPEAQEDIRNWGIDQVDETTRREIYVASDDSLNRIFDVNLHAFDELGVGQEYQRFYQQELGGVLPAGDDEICVGLDLRKNDAFVAPVREEIQVFEDDTLHRQKRAGIYGWMEGGFACLDNRRVILLSL